MNIKKPALVPITSSEANSEKVMKKTLAVVLSALLCACGGGGSPAPDQQPPAAAAAIQPKHVTIAMYGDSTTWGSTLVNGTYLQSPHNEPASLQLVLQRKYGPSVTVENHGVPGSTCAEILSGTAPVTTSWAQEMAHGDAQIVTANPAINDVFLPNLTDQDFMLCYQQLAQIAKQYGKTFVIMTPNPINDPHNANLWSLIHDEQYVAQAQGVAIVDQWNVIMASLPGWAADLPDNIHPNDALYEYKAQTSLAIVGPLVEAMEMERP